MHSCHVEAMGDRKNLCIAASLLSVDTLEPEELYSVASTQNGGVFGG